LGSGLAGWLPTAQAQPAFLVFGEVFFGYVIDAKNFCPVVRAVCNGVERYPGPVSERQFGSSSRNRSNGIHTDIYDTPPVIRFYPDDLILSRQAHSPPIAYLSTNYNIKFLSRQKYEIHRYTILTC
jgi:hypothetical protein